MVERGELLRFDQFLLDKQARALHRVLPDGGTMSIHIGSRAFQILCLLVDGAGQIIASRQIMDAVWPDIAVEQNNLAVQIFALRRVLDLDREQGTCIQNIPGRGYRFVPSVTQVTPAGATVDNALPANVPSGSDGTDDDAERAAPTDQPDPMPVSSLPPLGSARPGRVVRIALPGLAVAALVVVSIWHLGRTPAANAPAIPATIAAADRPRLSLVVLPFRNVDREDLSEDTVDAITDDLTSDLARVYDLFVIGRGSAFSYKGKPIDIKRVGDELGVRYAVEGSVRKVDGTLRVGVQLLSTETGAHVWADHFDLKRDGISYTVDDIVRPISHILNARIVDSESLRAMRERPANPDVIDLVLRARALNNLPPTPEKQLQRVKLWERAVELDSQSATALAGLAEALLDSIGSAEDPSAPEKLRRADDLVRRAELLRPNSMLVVFVRVFLLGKQRRCAEVFPAAQRAISIYPNITSTPFWLGLCLMFDGRAAEAIPQFEQSVRLNPRNPYVYNRYLGVGYAYLFLDCHDEAIKWFRKSLAEHPSDTPRNRAIALAAIASAEALAGRITQSQNTAAEALRLWPLLTVRGYYQTDFPMSPTNVAQVSRMRDGLRLAGVRDHADGDADHGLDSDSLLHTAYEALTPSTAPGAKTIHTSGLATLLRQEKPLVLDTVPWGKSIPGAIGLRGAGIGGTTSDEYQERLRSKMKQLTNGELTAPVVVMGWNAERFQGRNLALRLVALGYANVYWYRGGREAWELEGLPETELVLQDW